MDQEQLMKLAEAGYESYRADTGGIALATGARIPEWSMLRPAIQRAWCAAARGIAEAIAPRADRIEAALDRLEAVQGDGI